MPLTKVYGTYKASYPFGIETITLNQDGQFAQLIEIDGNASVIVHGKWKFDSSQGSRVIFDGFVSVVDGHGHLKDNWKHVRPGIASFDVEKAWFNVVLASAAACPYVKQ